MITLGRITEVRAVERRSPIPHKVVLLVVELVDVASNEALAGLIIGGRVKIDDQP